MFEGVRDGRDMIWLYMRRSQQVQVRSGGRQTGATRKAISLVMRLKQMPLWFRINMKSHCQATEETAKQNSIVNNEGSESRDEMI